MSGVVHPPELNQEELDKFEAQAYISACELDSPNSVGFDRLAEREFDKLIGNK